jgi:hypothetical protein
MQRVDEFGEGELSLVREISVVTTVLQGFHAQQRGIRELNKEDLVAGDSVEIIDIIANAVDVETIMRCDFQG